MERERQTSDAQYSFSAETDAQPIPEQQSAAPSHLTQVYSLS